MTSRKKRRTGLIIGSLILLLALGTGCFSFWYFHWNLSVRTQNFTESAQELHNPNRGFYYIYGFRIKDEINDWKTDVKDRMENDPDTSLALVEVNLQEYRFGEISHAGMDSRKALFAALEKQNKQYIVRFLYDWNGENEQYEPQNIDIIVGHMQQIEPILQKYADRIFTLQGLFIGNWGEMNGTKYTDQESMQRLASTLASVSDPGTYLSVRTPMQWRKITQTSEPDRLEESSPYTRRLGLFNDGMLGNESDYGTYGTQDKTEAGTYKEWTREEELDFQDTLCKTVPIGGEVIDDNVYNDLDNAVADFNRMHVTYLNEDYDRNVLDKWSNSTIHTEDCFDGMDGLTYMKARLGYRLVLKECRMQQDFWKDTLHMELDIQNVGFAPVYKECEAKMIFVPRTAEGKRYEIKLEQSLSDLPGGNDTEQVATIRTTIPLHSISKEDYDVYFQLCDKASGEPIYFGNEQECEVNGYKIAQIMQ